MVNRQAMLRTLISFAMLTIRAASADSIENEDRLKLIEAYVEGYQQIAAYDGVVVIAEGDEIIWQKAFGFADYRHQLAMDEQSVFRIASLSKQVTVAAVGRLIDQGKLTKESRLAEFLPDFPDADRITVAQLIDHSAGIAHTNRLEWMDMREGMSLDAIIAALGKEELLFAPGEDSQYSNGGYAVLAKIIETASGASYADFLQTEFANKAYSTLGHESAYEIVPSMVSRYAPGPEYGKRVEAETYITANRIGGGSLHANAIDLLRFYRDTYSGQLLSNATTALLFPLPEDGDVQITGRAPGALAQIYLHFPDDLTVLTLSSNSAWPASFNSDIVALYRGESIGLIPVNLATFEVSQSDLSAWTGDFIADRFGWTVSIVNEGADLVFVQDRVRTAFARTTAGEFHLPIYDWLCRYEDYDAEFECRQRDPSAEIRFRFIRR